MRIFLAKSFEDSGRAAGARASPWGHRVPRRLHRRDVAARIAAQAPSNTESTICARAPLATARGGGHLWRMATALPPRFDITRARDRAGRGDVLCPRARRIPTLAPSSPCTWTDWPAHEARVADFWANTILHERGYDGTPVKAHVRPATSSRACSRPGWRFSIRAGRRAAPRPGRRVVGACPQDRAVHARQRGRARDARGRRAEAALSLRRLRRGTLSRYSGV